MLAAARKDLLLERLHRDGRIVAKEIAAELGLSEDSIRRDLRELDAQGLAVRVYGGALPASPAGAPTPPPHHPAEAPAGGAGAWW
jgi:DeoR/GlpR family transcriptional regulator of sugar metabolism